MCMEPKESKYHKDLPKEAINLIEKLADIEHQRWASWQKYLHSKLKKIVIDVGNEKEESGYFLSEEDYNHWQRQINTPYAKLSEAEKDSDREQVMRYWPIITIPSGMYVSQRDGDYKVWLENELKIVEGKLELDKLKK